MERASSRVQSTKAALAASDQKCPSSSSADTVTPFIIVQPNVRASASFFESPPDTPLHSPSHSPLLTPQSSPSAFSLASTPQSSPSSFSNLVSPLSASPSVPSGAEASRATSWQTASAARSLDFSDANLSAANHRKSDEQVTDSKQTPWFLKRPAEIQTSSSQHLTVPSSVPSFTTSHHCSKDSTTNLKNAVSLFPASSPTSVQVPSCQEPSVGVEDFDILKVIGKGSFGKVFLVRHKQSKRPLAMKMLDKQHIILRRQVEHTKTERSILEYCQHPFIAAMRYAFQTPSHLFFVLDYYPGGELFFHLSREGRFSEVRARFYAAEILLALQYLHSKQVVYRDLKPENVLLDEEGHVALTDFGLAKQGIAHHLQRSYSFCGTPEYLAPEIISRVGHGRSADWWAFGALLFEMLTGLPPFYADDHEDMFHDILHGPLVIPSTVSVHAASLLQALLQRDPRKRLGSGPLGAYEIRQHPFFSEIDWQLLQAKKVVPPWKPVIKARQRPSPLTTSDARMQTTTSAPRQVPEEMPCPVHPPPGIPERDTANVTRALCDLKIFGAISSSGRDETEPDIPYCVRGKVMRHLSDASSSSSPSPPLSSDGIHEHTSKNHRPSALTRSSNTLNSPNVPNALQSVGHHIRNLLSSWMPRSLTHQEPGDSTASNHNSTVQDARDVTEVNSPLDSEPDTSNFDSAFTSLDCNDTLDEDSTFLQPFGTSSASFTSSGSSSQDLQSPERPGQKNTFARQWHFEGFEYCDPSLR